VSADKRQRLAHAVTQFAGTGVLRVQGEQRSTKSAGLGCARQTSQNVIRRVFRHRSLRNDLAPLGLKRLLEIYGLYALVLVVQILRPHPLQVFLFALALEELRNAFLPHRSNAQLEFAARHHCVGQGFYQLGVEARVLQLATYALLKQAIQ
jgi:hypothetical protein